MKVTVLEKEKAYQLIDDRHNPPVILSKQDEEKFQTDIRGLYESLRMSLGKLGDEGDYYDVSDFALRPDLRNRATVSASPAPQVREILVIILKEKFYRKGFLPILRRCLVTKGSGYRIHISQDFDPKWTLHMFLTANCAQLYCSHPHEFAKLNEELFKL